MCFCLYQEVQQRVSVWCNVLLMIPLSRALVISCPFIDVLFLVG